MTGKIMAEYHADLATVQAKCKGAQGCTRAVGFRDYVFITAKGEYEIWYSEQSLRTHEQCHALFEATEHTK